MCRIVNFIKIIILLLLLSSSGFALPSDNKQRLLIVSDSTIYNYKMGENIFEGHVKADQGTTHITADRIITKANKKHIIVEVTAYGLSGIAHYWTLTKEDEPEMHAYAKIIKFYPVESNVTLEKAVRITQGENSFQGELIHYNSNQQTITVPASDSGRSVLVYNPDKSK